MKYSRWPLYNSIYVLEGLYVSDVSSGGTHVTSESGTLDVLGSRSAAQSVPTPLILTAQPAPSTAPAAHYDLSGGGPAALAQPFKWLN